MKNLIFVLTLSCAFSIVSLNAQTCSHAKKGTQASCTAGSGDQAYITAASEAATKDASIEKRSCKESGKVCFFKNTKDDQGKTVSSEVMYDQGTASFVSAVSSTDAGSKKACCAGSKKACCAKGAKSCSKDKEVKSENKIMN
ncbi:MAG: hypothetical protein ABI851_04175 [Saprospiraceae bacterium]